MLRDRNTRRRAGKVLLIAAIAIAAVFAFRGCAEAQAQVTPRLCQATPLMVHGLSERYGEAHMQTIDYNEANGIRLDLYASGASGTWTLLATRGEISCIVATGEHYAGHLPAQPMGFRVRFRV